MSTKSDVVILGHRGLVGRALVEAYQRRAVARVRGLSRAECDLAQPQAAEVVAGCCSPASTLIMAAAVTREVADGLDAAQANLAMAMTVTRVLDRVPVARCVYVSTASVYGHPKSAAPVSEATPADPDSPYAVAKYAAERLLRQVAIARGIPLLIVRPCRIYGPGETRAAYGPSRFVADALQHGRIELFGDGHELRDHLFVDDVAEAVAGLCERGAEGVFGLATGCSRSFAELVELIHARVPQPINVVQRPRNAPAVDQWFAIAKLRQALPRWQPVDLADGVRCLIEAWQPLPASSGAPVCAK